jgi:replicative DNA helicase
LHLCRGEPTGEEFIMVKAGSPFRSYRRRDEPRPERNGKHPPPRPKVDWQALAEQYAAALTPARNRDLAAALGLPVEAIDAVDLVGWKADEECWTFPEWNGAGAIVGISRRYSSGEKKAMQGGGRGLTIPRGWRDKDGPLFLVEGPSDVLALSLCGLAAIGRPSNVGGLDQLGELLSSYSGKVIVVGENDQKPSGKWPGREGAEATTKRLAARLKGSGVTWAMPPAGVKDCRDWVNELEADWGSESEPWQHIGEAIRTELTKSAASSSRFQFPDVADLLEGDYGPRWLVERCLVRGQPGIIAGPSKCLKTSLSIDLVVSLASARPFLNKFPVPRRIRTAIVSGESGEHTIQETIRRVMTARGLAVNDLAGFLKVEFNVPIFTDAALMHDFAAHLQRIEADVVVIDPTYLTLGDVDAKNLFEMGRALRGINDYLQTVRPDLTVILVHHANRQLPAGEPMELTHLSYSGLEQYARQWLLLNRREKYDSNGPHKLWLGIGGSVGMGGLWGLDVDEGRLDKHFQGRTWNVSLYAPDELKTEEASEQRAAKRESRRQEIDEAENQVLRAIDQAKVPLTKSQLRALTDLHQRRVDDVVIRLLSREVIEEVEFRQSRGNGAVATARGYRRKAE